MGAKSNPPPTTTVRCISSLHAYSYIQQSGRSVISTNAKNTKNKSPIHENADANITCDFGDGDISRSRSRLPHGHTVSSVIVIGMRNCNSAFDFIRLPATREASLFVDLKGRDVM